MPVEEAMITYLGVEGDDHNDKTHHGGPDAALCLFSLEAINALQVEGHRIFPGATGENITVAQADWSRMIPGSEWRLGDEVEIEVTAYTTPCRNQVNWFVDGDFSRINQAKHPGWSRVYARVLREGRVRRLDPVVQTSPTS